MQASAEKDNRIKGLAISVTLHALLLLVCFFATISIPIGESEGSGIILNYGTDEEGMGADAFSTENIASGATPTLTPVFEKSAPEPAQDGEQTDKSIVTQDEEDAPIVPSADKKVSITTKPTENTTTEPNTTVNEKDIAIYKGPKSTGGSKGDGTGTKPGNQGTSDGDINSGNYGSGNSEGFGSGNGGIALNLIGRKFLVKPIIRDDGQTQGKIVVEIKVDKTGTIIEATAGYRGTTLSNTSLWRKCEKAVLGAKLNSLSTAPDLQIGTVIFNFDLQ